MLDLFLPKITRLYGPTVDSRLSPEEQAKKEKRRAYWRAYHLKRREARLQAMRDRYQTHKQEYIDRAHEWRAANPEKYRAIKRRSDALHSNVRLKLKGKA